jgi:hypothetical protein
VLVATFWDPKKAKDDSLVACIKDIRKALGAYGRSVITDRLPQLWLAVEA